MRVFVRRILVGVCLIASAAAVEASVLFHDDFSTPGTKLDLAAWTTEIGPSSFLGRTQLADWITPGGIGQFVVANGKAQLALHTFNPTGFSLFGTHGKTHATFVPGPGEVIELKARVQLSSLQMGVVWGIYLFGCANGPCATNHDEIDFELLGNTLQATPLQVQVNYYANEPLGAGNGGLVALPAGFDPLATHDWTIRWSLARIEFWVDGVRLSTATTHVPQSPMSANLIAWGPASDWSAAYSDVLQPVASAPQNQSFSALVDALTVSGGPDADGDLVADDVDNCPFAVNSDQRNRGGVGAAAPADGLGDACQCGDVTGNGRVTSADAVAITRSLLVPPTATLANSALCDVGGASGCSSADATIVARALLVPPSAAIQSVCDPATP